MPSGEPPGVAGKNTNIADGIEKSIVADFHRSKRSVQGEMVGEFNQSLTHIIRMDMDNVNISFLLCRMFHLKKRGGNHRYINFSE
jgi:hypothetical protein